MTTGPSSFNLKDETIDWLVIFTVLLQVFILPLILMDMGTYMRIAGDSYFSGDFLYDLKHLLNIPLMLKYMGVDLDIDVYVWTIKHLLTVIEGLLLLAQLYFGYLILARRGRSIILKILILVPIYVATIKLYIVWGVFFSIPLN